MASSRIEGLVLSHRRLARAAFEPDATRDETARQVLGNIRAMEQAVAVGAGEPITMERLLQTHKVLLEHTQLAAMAGVVRTEQNWIGGSHYGPVGAEFVPPPPEHVPALLTDLVAFLQRVDIAPTIQAGIAHAQFETIHPFLDGNGRAGRCLIHSVLRGRGAATRATPPISLVLAGRGSAYIAGLGAFRAGNLDRWLVEFARANTEAIEAARALARELRDLVQSWRERAGHPRRGSSSEAVIAALPANPVLDVSTGMRLTGRSREAVRRSFEQLSGASVISTAPGRGRGRIWEARELFALIDDFEARVVGKRH